MEEKEKQEQGTPGTREMVVIEDNSDFSHLLDSQKFEHLQRVAAVFSESDLVPAHYRGNLPNCIIATQTAFQLKVNPMTFMQKSYVIKGKPGIEATLAIGLMNKSHLFTDAIQYKLEGGGPTRQCTASATTVKTGQLHEMTITWAQVVANRWDQKDGSQWKTNPDLMFKYRSAMWLIRTTHPEVILGLASSDELMDMDRPGPRDVTPRATVAVKDVAEEGENELRAELWLALIDKEKTEAIGAELGMEIERFLQETAVANGITRSNLITQALSKLKGFWESFMAWPGEQSQTSQEPAEATTGPPETPKPTTDPKSRAQSEKERDALITKAIKACFAGSILKEDLMPMVANIRENLPNMKVADKTIIAVWEDIKAKAKSALTGQDQAPPVDAQAETRWNRIKTAVIAQKQEVDDHLALNPADLGPNEPFPKGPGLLIPYVKMIVKDATEEEIMAANEEVVKAQEKSE